MRGIVFLPNIILITAGVSDFLLNYDLYIFSSLGIFLSILDQLLGHDWFSWLGKHCNVH